MIERRRGLGVVALLFVLVALGHEDAAGSEAIFANWLSGADGFEQAIERRRGTSDVMLLYFYTDWCPYCRRLNNDILGSPVMQEYIDHVIAVRINPEKGAREDALAKAHGVNGYPGFFVVPPGTSQPVHIHPFSKQDGSSTWSAMTPEEFRRACEEAGGVHHKKTGQTSTKPKVSRKVSATTPKAPTSRAVFAPRRPVTLYLKNGEQLEGDLIKETPAAVTLGLEYGEVVFERTEIDRLVTATPETASPETP